MQHNGHFGCLVLVSGDMAGGGVPCWRALHVTSVLTVLPAWLQDGTTALMWAAWRGSAECVRAVLGADGVDVNVRDNVSDVVCG